MSYAGTGPLPTWPAGRAYSARATRVDALRTIDTTTGTPDRVWHGDKLWGVQSVTAIEDGRLCVVLAENWGQTYTFTAQPDDRVPCTR